MPAAGLSRIVFTSIIDVDPESPFYFAPVYRDAERRLAASGTPSTIVRCGLYSDFILEHWLKPSVKFGEVLLAAGHVNGRLILQRFNAAYRSEGRC
jgi:NAD(P)H dehydrogenase (quinone)